MAVLESFVGIIGTLLLVTIGWAFRTTSTVSVLDERCNGLEKLLDIKDDDLRELISSRFDAIEGRLDRIERSMNGALVKH
jgi:hypothetical protein